MLPTGAHPKAPTPRSAEAATALGPLALVHYDPLQHVETRLLEALSQALPWSDAVATVLREAIARAGPSHVAVPSAAGRSTAGGCYERSYVKREAKGGAARRARDPGRHSYSRRGDSGSGSDPGAGGSESNSRSRRRGFAWAGDGTSPLLPTDAIHLALATLGGVPGYLTGAAEGRCSAAAFAVSVAMASAAEGGLPQPLLRVVSPYRAGLDQLRPLGKGGFGSVVAVRSRLDRRLMALKTVAFRSELPPWAPPEQLECQHAKLLREVQALAALDGSPHVVRYYNAWIEPAWEKLGQQIQRSGGAHASGAAQASMKSMLHALSAAKVKAGQQQAASGCQIRKSSTGGHVAPRAAAAATADAPPPPAQGSHLARLRSRVILPRLARIDSDRSGSQSCRIRELHGSRCSSTHAGSSRSQSADGAGDGDGGPGSGAAAPSCRKARRSHAGGSRTSPHRLVHGATTQLRPTLPAEPLVDLPVSPDGTISADPSAVAAAAAPREVAVRLQPIVSLPPSSTELSRRRSLDASHGASSAGILSDSDATATAAAVAPPPLVLLASMVEDQGPFARGWSVPQPAGLRWQQWQHHDRQLSPLHSQPLITSLSTSPEGPAGATPTRGSLLSSSVESIRVPPGARIAAVTSTGVHRTGSSAGSGGGGCVHSASSNNSTGEETDSGGSETSTKRAGARRSSGARRVRQLFQQPEKQYSWTFDRGDEPTRSSVSRASSTDTSFETSSTEAGSCTAATDAAATRGLLGGEEEDAEDFSWTFDRGSDRDMEAGGGGDGGGADVGRCGSASERKSRKGRRGKAGGDTSKRESKGGSEGLLRLEGLASASERTTRARLRSQSSSSSSESYSDSGSSDSSGSESGNWSENISEARIGSYSESDGGSGSDGSKSEDDVRRQHRHDRGAAGAIIPPSQSPLPAPRHRCRQQPLVSSPTQDSASGAQMDLRRRQRRRQPRRRRRSSCPQQHVPALEGAARGTSAAAAAGLPAAAAATAFDLAVLSGIRRWPYTLYISMELVMGPTLTRWLQLRAEQLAAGSPGGRLPEHPPEPLARERSIFRQIVTGLAHVHAAGIIHRDLKPANIFLVKLVTAPGMASSGGGFGAGTGGGREGFPAGRDGAPATRAALEQYLVKLGDFGLAAEHEEASILKEASASFNSSSLPSAAGASSSLSASSHQGPFVSADGPAASVAAAAAGGPVRFCRPSSLPLLPDVPEAEWDGDGGVQAAAVRRPSSAGANGGGADSGLMPRMASVSTFAHTSGVGTASYSAPEQLREQSGGVSYYGPEVDIYPLGLILMELFCVHGTAMERADAMREARQGRLPASLQRAYPGEARLAEACLCARPEQRPSAANILALLDILWGPQPPQPAVGAAAAAAAGGGTSAASSCGPGRSGGGRVRGPDIDAIGAAACWQEASRGDMAQGWRLGHRIEEGANGDARLRQLHAAAPAALHRSVSGPLPPSRRQWAPPPLPFLPLPPPSCTPLSPAHLANAVACPSPRHTASYGDALDGADSYLTAVAAMLGDAGTQTDLTWVPEDQPLPLPLSLPQAAAAEEGRAGGAAAPTDHVEVHVACHDDPALAAATTAARHTAAAASWLAPSLGCKPVVGRDRGEAAAGSAAGTPGRAAAAASVDGGGGDSAALLVRLRMMEAEVRRLRQQLQAGSEPA